MTFENPEIKRLHFASPESFEDMIVKAEEIDFTGLALTKLMLVIQQHNIFSIIHFTN